ncbi:MAG: restriction endonuclease subunit S [Chloroflexi bacterium HGW-Chloroflexi-2]|jgi:type I restriction enzyme M protein|nr:MAG: restriction endonuclease subunit S [Chloroflexi bacterium HGW-Chloroflexi-2]
MLDNETKQRINTARDILVGKVPDPKSQVEQITIALTYKFMDDMDQEALAMGGKASFFVGEYEKYGWTKMFDPHLGGFEMLALYSEAITRMSENPHIEPLFRQIFKNAYLPYRDPETLKLFLKTINEFHYDHSEKLGDAFEYLLSVLGSQGDAGQFRTPRHIIEFMVAVVAPKKHDTILDPACGTAGFLISAYKFIRQSNTEKVPGDLLSVQDRARMVNNFSGYDISPDMVRLSLVNMYLHGFTNPRIHEYDTLTSEERWHEYADVILANPPFMSPKGGIRPHKKFSVQSKRSEVLFVDYMAEHLTASGRAAIIVPEGIIFQSGSAYKELRKYLVEKNYLWAVVSLPSGVFQPYSGVKTSILFMDKVLARKSDQILFVKVENDGFDLGAQRRAFDKNDLPAAQSLMQAWQQAMIEKGGEGFDLSLDTDISALLVEKSRLAENGEYNLSSDRYKIELKAQTKQFPMINIGEICVFEYGKPLKAENRIDGEFPVYGSNGIVGYHNEYLVEAPFIIVGRKGSAGSVHYSEKNGFPIDTTFYIKLENENTIILKYLFHILSSLDLKNVNTQAGVPGLNRNDAYNLEIPLPPLEVQREIVAEIEGYQRIIDGARMVVENWKPNIELELEEARKESGVEEWEMVKLGEVCEVKGGKRLPKGELFANEETPYPYIRVSDFSNGNINTENLKYISNEIHKEIKNYTISSDNVYISIAGTIGLFGVIPDKLDGANLTENAAKFIFDNKVMNKYFLSYIGNSKQVQIQIISLTHAVGVPKLALERIRKIEIPLPPIEIQGKIVEIINNEEKLVETSKKLIVIYQKKITQIMNNIWGE